MNCNVEFFPNIAFLLKVLITLPVSIARTFSTLERVNVTYEIQMGKID